LVDARSNAAINHMPTGLWRVAMKRIDTLDDIAEPDRSGELWVSVAGCFQGTGWSGRRRKNASPPAGPGVLIGCFGMGEGAIPFEEAVGNILHEGFDGLPEKQ
jgi:hypothetical protein